MSENSKIEWTDHTFNPWEGCTKVGPGCDHCYAEARNARFGGGIAVNWGPGAPRRRTSASNWRKPLQWNARPFFECPDCQWRGHDAASVNGLPTCPNVRCASLELVRTRPRVFCASLADVFDNAVDPVWRADLFALIRQTPNLDWLLLTKRIGNVPAMLAEIDVAVLPWNVWLGATIVNRPEMLRDAEKLLSVPASVRFWSVEPMLGDLGDIPPELLPDWVICGGESGHGARPMHPDWPRALRDQCAAAGVPFLFKQWGEWTAGELSPHPDFTDDHESAWRLDQRGKYWNDPYEAGLPVEECASVKFIKVGKSDAGRLLDGRTHDEFPRGAA